MKSILTLLLFIAVSIGGFAQKATSFIDSLENVLANIRNTKPGSKEEAWTLMNLCYYTQNEPIKSLAYGQQAIELSRKIGYKKGEAVTLSYLGTSEKYQGNYNAAIDYYIQSTNLLHELNMVHEEANNISALATIYGTIGDQRNSIHYFKQAIQLLSAFNDTFFVASAQLNLGEYYRKYAEVDSAIYYFNTSLKNLESIKIKEHPKLINENVATIKGNLGMIYLEQGQIDKAKLYLEYADRYFTENFEAYRKSVYQSELGKMYILKGDLKKGEDLIKISLQMAKGDLLKEQIRDFNQQLASFYEEQKQYKLALYHFKEYKLYSDSLNNVENVRKLEQQQSQFQLSRKDEEISALNKINKLQQTIGLGLLFGVVVVMVFIFFVIRSNRRIKLINHEITLQKHLVEEREKEKALLLRELNHRVKNNLQMVASLLNLHSRQLKGHPAADALMAGKYRVEALTLIHQKLYRDDVDTKIDLKEYIEELAKNLVMNFSQDFKLELYLVSFVMKIDKAIPLGLILNELLTNSLKYGKIEGQQPVLRISIQKLPENVILKIEDNGKGLPANFDFKRAESFGLKLVHSLINQLGGKIEWSADKGTHWTITLNTIKIN